MNHDLETVLDRAAQRRDAADFGPVGDADDGLSDPVARRFAGLLSDRSVRPEHRARMYEDLVRSRDLVLRWRDERLADLVYWSEQVERLYGSLRVGRLQTFHYARALEATCRRCGFELLPVMGKMEELGKCWGGRDYAAVKAMLLPDVVEIDPPGETSQQLGPQE